MELGRKIVAGCSVVALVFGPLAVELGDEELAEGALELGADSRALTLGGNESGVSPVLACS